VQVDTHTHVIADDEARYPLTPLEPTGGWYREVPHTVEGLLALMDGAGVDRAVLVQAVSAYQHDNRYVADAARAHGDRCTSVACLDPSDPRALPELRRLVEEQGVRGLRWWALRDEPLAEPRVVWDDLATLGIPVVVTMFADRLPELLALVPSLPDVQIAIDHCAFVDFSGGVPDGLTAVAEHPNVSCKVSTIVLDRLAEHGDVRDGLAELAARVGADRLLWGSDFSQTHDRPYPELAEYARHAASRLADDARAAFLGANALRLWPELTA
jgi:predicted TIM-barrel fold metal-dependent hydrolase